MPKQNIGWIYLIKNKINGKLYVGRTNNFKRRYNEHFKKVDTCTILRKAYDKYGKENFEMVPILSFNASNTEVLNEVLNLLEKFYIEKYHTYKNGYNATLGGDGNCGWKPSLETCQKRGAALKGRKYSQERIERMREIALKQVWTEEEKEIRRQRLRKILKDPEVQKKLKQCAEKRKGVKRDRDVIMKGAIKRRKPVLQYGMDGLFIQEYESLSSIDKYKRINIGACCMGKLNSAYGYIWKYKASDNYPMRVEVPTVWHKSNKPVLQYDKLGNFIQEYKSTTVASEITNIGRKAISNCLIGLSKSAGGFVWKYKNQSI